jgi:hypothetical protein
MRTFHLVISTKRHGTVLERYALEAVESASCRESDNRAQFFMHAPPASTRPVETLQQLDERVDIHLV